MKKSETVSSLRRQSGGLSSQQSKVDRISGKDGFETGVKKEMSEDSEAQSSVV